MKRSTSSTAPTASAFLGGISRAMDFKQVPAKGGSTQHGGREGRNVLTDRALIALFTFLTTIILAALGLRP